MDNSKLVFVLANNANFRGASMSQADLSVSKCVNTDFSFADLDFGKLRGGDYSNSRFIGTILTMADISESNLLGVDFSGAQMFGINMDDCLTDDFKEEQMIIYKKENKMDLIEGRSVYASSGRNVYAANSRYIGSSRYVQT